MERGSSYLESLPQELLEAIVSASENIRNVRKASKTLRTDLGGPLGELTPLTYHLGTNLPIFSLVKKYLSHQDIDNVKLVSTGAYNLAQEKDWKEILDQELNHTPPDRMRSKIYSFLDIYSGDRFHKILKYVIDKYNIDPVTYIIYHNRRIRPGITQLLENYDVISYLASKGNYIYYYPIHLLADALKRENNEDRKLEMIKTMIELYMYGFNPNYRTIYDQTVFDILGDDLVEKIFDINKSNLPDSYSIQGSKLAKYLT